MKKSLASLLIFSLLSPCLMSAQPDPCQDKELLRLKDVNINDMTDREYQYFIMMSEECADDDGEKKSIRKHKPKILWLTIGIAALYVLYDEVIDDKKDDDENDDEDDD